MVIQQFVFPQAVDRTRLTGRLISFCFIKICLKVEEQKENKVKNANFSNELSIRFRRPRSPNL